MSEELQCILTEVTCRRVVYCFRGYSQTGKECRLYFRQPDKQLTIEPTLVRWENGSFVMYLNTETADREYPLPSGRYILMSETGPVKPSEHLEASRMQGSDTAHNPSVQPSEPLEGQMDVRIYKNRFHYLTCSSGCDEDTFFLEVDAQLPRKRKYYREGEIARYSIDLREDLKSLAEQLFRMAFRCIRLFTRRNGKTILFTSGSRASLGGNEEWIYRRMVERGLDRDYTILFDFKESIRVRKSLPDMFVFLRRLARADVIVLDDYYPEIGKLTFDPDVRVFQVWHACGAFKTVGLERMDKPGAPPINSRAHKCYTHVPVSSELAAMHCQEAFGIDYSKFYPVGVPRTDIFFDQEYKERICRQLYRQFPRAKKARKTFLYAPTFRGNSALDAGFPMDRLDLKRWGKLCRSMGDHLIIKMHPFVREHVSVPEGFEDVITDASDYREINDLLFIADVLITDYSSVIYEFSLLRRPILMYAFDLEEYEADRGFYETYENTVPGPIFQTFDALMDYIRQDTYDRAELDRFIEKNFTYTDGHATDRVIDLMLEGSKGLICG